MLIKSLRIIFLSLLVLSSANSQVALDSAIVIDELIIYFDSDEFNVDQRAIEEIEALCVKIDSFDEVKFYIDAHTDVIGSEDYNLTLSDKRRKSVKEALIHYGIADSLIRSEYLGEQALLTEASNPAENRLNRRARIRVTHERELIFLQGRIIDPENGEGIRAEVSVSTEDFRNSTTTDSTGRFRVLSPIYAKVNLEVLALNYFIETNTIMVSDRHKTLELKVPLPKLELGKRYHFKNMLFEGNRSVLLPGSEQAAQQLKRFMILNKDVCIEISGHVNYPMRGDVSHTSGEFELSVARATEIKNLVLEQGVQEGRMLAKGYGNWQMKFPNPRSEREMTMNRRVEIGILDCARSADISDDQISDLGRYREFHANRRYNYRLSKYDLPNPQDLQTVRSQASAMLKNGMDPTKYSYYEIMSAHPDLPAAKEVKE